MILVRPPPEVELAEVARKSILGEIFINSDNSNYPSQ